MFRHEGSAREGRHNRRLAGYLATVAGFVNAAGFVLAGNYTSHASGNVSRAADDLASGRPISSASAIVLVASFFMGAFVASMAIEGRPPQRLPFVYGALLLGEAVLIGVFMGVTDDLLAKSGVHDAESAVLCAAMGLQNSLVTRLSGAVVRTTHVTGVVTDLGIEAARWFRFWRLRMLRRLHVGLVQDPPERPHGPKIALLLTIFAAFALGSGIGALTSAHFHARALILPLVMLVVGAVYAFVSGRAWGGRDSRK